MFHSRLSVSAALVILELPIVRQDVLESLDVLNQDILVMNSCRNDMVGRHIRQYARFDLDFLDQIFHVDFVTGVDFRFVEHFVFVEQFRIGFAAENLECVRNALDAFEPASVGFAQPFGAVSVAFEPDFFRFDDVFADDL